MMIRKGDLVKVMTGDDKGTSARVLRVIRAEGKVVVEGVNKVYRHMRPSQRNPQGGRLSKEMPIHASNVQLVDPSTGKATRVGVRVLADGTKERFAKKSGASLGSIGRAKAKAK